MHLGIRQKKHFKCVLNDHFKCNLNAKSMLLNVHFECILNALRIRKGNDPENCKTVTQGSGVTFAKVSVGPDLQEVDSLNQVKILGNRWDFREDLLYGGLSLS